MCMCVCETDKSGKFSVMRQDVYLEAGDEHVKNDKILTEKELRGVERRLNAGCSMFIKIFWVGEQVDHIERHRSNSITHLANPSHMKLYHKDHKPPGKVHMRRTNGPGLNLPFSNYLADVLEPIANEMVEKREFGSTETFLNQVDMYNKGVVEEGVRRYCMTILDD